MIFKKLYAKIFAKFYDKFMNSFEKKIAKDRKKLGQLTGLVLDVGSGTGINFEYFNNSVQVFAVEPSRPMQDKSLKKVKEKNITLINLGINDVKLQSIIKNHSIDTIVSTLVLCTIPNPDLALENFKRWLKPNGKLIVLEHIHSEKKPQAKLETFFNPFWKIFADGCNLNRHTDVLIKEKGFKVKEQQYFTIGLRIHKAVYTLN